MVELNDDEGVFQRWLFHDSALENLGQAKPKSLGMHRHAGRHFITFSSSPEGMIEFD